MPYNNAKPMTILYAVIAVAGIALAAFGGFAGGRDANGIGMLGILVFVFSAVYFGMYLSQATRLSHMFRGEDLLAHWTYSDAEYEEYAYNAAIQQKSGSRTFQWIAAALLIAFAVYYTVTEIGDSKASIRNIAFLVILGIGGIAAITEPIRANNRIQNAVREAYIGMNCAWVMGNYAIWTVARMRLNDIRTEKTGPETAEVIIRYMTTGRYKRTRTLTIPIPMGKEAEAIRAVNLIRAENRFPELD